LGNLKGAFAYIIFWCASLVLSWLQDVLLEIGRSFWIIVNKLYEVATQGYNVIVRYAGEPAGFLFVAVAFILIPFFFLTMMISRWQAGLESFQAALAKLFMRLTATFILTFVILYVLSQA